MSKVRKTYRTPVRMTNEKRARKLFEAYCAEGVRPLMYDLTQVANGEYASCFTEWAWKCYWRGINDADGVPNV